MMVDSRVNQRDFLPYGRHIIDNDDIASVIEVLKSDWLTCGPKVKEFEEAVAAFCAADHGVAVSSGTAALHGAMHAIGIAGGDEVIVPTMTFAASANSVVYAGGTPVFADVRPETLLIDPDKVESLITPRTKAIVAVDYAGQPCDYDELRTIADRHSLVLIADSCHSLGSSYKGRMTGSIADMTIFSFHPVKHIATGEGGMVVTNSQEWAEKIACFRNHGITTNPKQRQDNGTWFYQMEELGYNYRLTDIQCALGLSQLKKLPQWLECRNNLAACYAENLTSIQNIQPLLTQKDCKHAYHLYVIRLAAAVNREFVFKALHQDGIGVNVHYIPVHRHPYYQGKFGCAAGLCPVAEEAYEHILTLPLHPAMSTSDVDYVSECISRVV
jgi:perosamine synthetase